MKFLLYLLLGLYVSTTQPILGAVAAERCIGSGNAQGGVIGVGVECTFPASSTPATVGAPTQRDAPYVQYAWASVCAVGPRPEGPILECNASMTCDSARLRRWQLWAQRRDGSWLTIRTQCFGATPPEYVPPTVTAGDVISALRRVGLPRHEALIQPEAKTLVNFDTIFHTNPEEVSLNLTILGQEVDVIATPSSYRWIFGDGASAITGTPGEPYPAKDVVHRYSDARVTVHPHVEVTYAARFRVNGGAWQDIDETVTTVGPDATLRVAEAIPMLSREHR